MRVRTRAEAHLTLSAPCLGCGRSLVHNRFFCSNACMLATPATPAIGLAMLMRASRMLPAQPSIKEREAMV